MSINVKYQTAKVIEESELMVELQTESGEIFWISKEKYFAPSSKPSSRSTALEGRRKAAAKLKHIGYRDPATREIVRDFSEA